MNVVADGNSVDSQHIIGSNKCREYIDTVGNISLEYLNVVKELKGAIERSFSKEEYFLNIITKRVGSQETLMDNVELDELIFKDVQISLIQNLES